MPAGNFNQQLHVNPTSGFVEWPTGPLVRAPSETITRVEVWVIQKLTGAIQMTWQNNFSPPYTTWTADRIWHPKPPTGSTTWSGGIFQSGRPALGIAVVTATLPSGAQRAFWWSEEVELI